MELSVPVYEDEKGDLSFGVTPDGSEVLVDMTEEDFDYIDYFLYEGDDVQFKRIQFVLRNMYEASK